MGINAFTRGMRSVNPKAEVKVIWVNSWFDPGKEREAADTLISQGADVLTHHTDSTAVVQAAEEKKVYAVAYHSDMSKYGPKAQLTARHPPLGRLLHQGRADVTRRQVEAGQRLGRHQGRHDQDGAVQRGRAAGRAGPGQQGRGRDRRRQVPSLHRPGEGPRRQGARSPPARRSPTTDLSKMDYYVEGVQGKLPEVGDLRRHRAAAHAAGRLRDGELRPAVYAATFTIAAHRAPPSRPRAHRGENHRRLSRTMSLTVTVVTPRRRGAPAAERQRLPM